MSGKRNSPIIETIINTTALALTAYGVQAITSDNWRGYIAMCAGILLEFIKYYGRKTKFW